jgi:hypothetical protein
MLKTLKEILALTGAFALGVFVAVQLMKKHDHEHLWDMDEDGEDGFDFPDWHYLPWDSRFSERW